VWDYTPRQAVGYFILHRLRKRREHADLLGIMTLAARGDKDALDKQFKQLAAEDS
jgi:hypothetical protein